MLGRVVNCHDYVVLLYRIRNVSWSLLVLKVQYLKFAEFVATLVRVYCPSSVMKGRSQQIIFEVLPVRARLSRVIPLTSKKKRIACLQFSLTVRSLMKVPVDPKSTAVIRTLFFGIFCTGQHPEKGYERFLS